MKVLQQQLKNIFGIALALVFAVSLFAALPTAAAPGDASRVPLNPGNDAQPITQFRVGDTLLSDVGFDVSGLGDVSSFDRQGSLMVVFGNLVSTATNYLGAKASFDIQQGLNLVSLPTQTMNINGTLLATSLNHPGSPEQRPLCVGKEGILFLCDNQGPTPQWQTGAWGQCSNGEQSRPVSCMEGSTIVDDSQCPPPKPAETQSCGTHNWVQGGWGPCEGGLQVQTVICQDENGNQVSNALCPSPMPDTSQACDDGSNNPDPDTYSWNIPDWSPCINGTITRDVTCEDQDGNTVADNLCPDPDPIESQSCDTYDWATGPWGICDTGSGGSCSGTPLNAGSSNCQPGAQLGSFPVNPPSGYDYVFSCASQTSEAACQDTIQTLDATAFDNSDVRYCQWEEPVPAGTKVDFNGDPFDWDPQWIYYAPGSSAPVDGLGIVCGVNDPNDATTSSCIGYSPAAIPTSGSGTINGQYWTVIPFGANAGSWYPVSLQYGPCPESGFGCGTRPMGGGQDGNSVLQEFVVQSATGNAFGTGTDNGNTVTCNARNQSVCEAIPGCTWNQILGGGNQTRAVECQNQDGVTVDDSLCTDPRPDDVQACS